MGEVNDGIDEMAQHYLGSPTVFAIEAKYRGGNLYKTCRFKIDVCMMTMDPGRRLVDGDWRRMRSRSQVRGSLLPREQNEPEEQLKLDAGSGQDWPPGHGYVIQRAERLCRKSRPGRGSGA